MSYSFSSSSVWERTERTTYDSERMGERTFVAAVTMFTLYGLLLSTLVAWACLSWQPSLTAFIVLGLVLPFAGIMIAGSGNPIASLLGYSMVACGLGAILGPFVALIKAPTLIAVLQVTFGVTLVASIVGIVYPKSLESWGMYLFTGLLALLLVRVAQMLMAGFGMSATIWYIPLIEYGAALLFTLYIVYDWNRAMRVPRTLDNSIDCALAIYLDIVNLFITLARIYLEKDS